MLQQPNLELQLFVGFGKLPRSFRDSPIEFNRNLFLLIQAHRLLQPDSQLICSYSKHQVLGLFRKAQPLGTRHDESELAVYSQSDRKERNVLSLPDGQVQ